MRGYAALAINCTLVFWLVPLGSIGTQIAHAQDHEDDGLSANIVLNIDRYRIDRIRIVAYHYYFNGLDWELGAVHTVYGTTTPIKEDDPDIAGFTYVWEKSAADGKWTVVVEALQLEGDLEVIKERNRMENIYISSE